MLPLFVYYVLEFALWLFVRFGSYEVTIEYRIPFWSKSVQWLQWLFGSRDFVKFLTKVRGPRTDVQPQL